MDPCFQSCDQLCSKFRIISLTLSWQGKLGKRAKTRHLPPPKKILRDTRQPFWFLNHLGKSVFSRGVGIYNVGLVNQLYICLFLDFFPIEVSTEHWVEFPGLHSRVSLVIYFIHSINRVYTSTPVSQFIPSPLSTLQIYIFVLFVCVSSSASFKIICTNYFRFHICALIYWICFSLSDLTSLCITLGLT